jgi:hypothetical protein
MADEQDRAQRAFELSTSEYKTLRRFYFRHKHRWWYHVLLGLILLYCVVMAGACVYFAWSMFTGEGEIEKIEARLPADSDRIAGQLEPVRRFFDKVNIFNIAWTTVLHGALLLYIGLRLFGRLRRARLRAPQAALAVKLADRLVELGEIEAVGK